MENIDITFYLVMLTHTCTPLNGRVVLLKAGKGSYPMLKDTHYLNKSVRNVNSRDNLNKKLEGEL